MKLKDTLIDNAYMAFDICGEIYKLSEYDLAIKKNHDLLHAYYEEIQDFPYTIKLLVNNNIEKIRDAPLFIIYRDNRISFYDFINTVWTFESQLPLSKSTNCLEVYNDFELAARHFKNNDDFHSVIYETFRVLQDLHYLIPTSRWALMQAHRILHFRSGLVWDNGWEQLWTRAAWLNNAIVMYDSCFDKLVQAIWIGTESFVTQKGYTRLSLSNVGQLEKIYKDCWRRNELIKIPELFNIKIIDFQKSNHGKRISNYAQKIKHRGGMRYDGLFPFGQIAIVDDGYDPYTTRNIQDIDVVISELKEYHIALIELADSVTENLINVFKQHGYLTGEVIVL